jgi:hypothetical protein
MSKAPTQQTLATRVGDVHLDIDHAAALTQCPEGR